MKPIDGHALAAHIENLCGMYSNKKETSAYMAACRSAMDKVSDLIAEGWYDLGTCGTCMDRYYFEDTRQYRCGTTGLYCEFIKYCGLWEGKS